MWAYEDTGFRAELCCTSTLLVIYYHSIKIKQKKVHLSYLKDVDIFKFITIVTAYITERVELLEIVNTPLKIISLARHLVYW